MATKVTSNNNNQKTGVAALEGSSLEKLSLTKVTSSAFHEFTKRLTNEQVSAIQKKWEWTEIESLAATMTGELRSLSAYKTAVFAHPDLEYIAFYAARPETEEKTRLTVSELSDVLTYKAACDTFKTGMKTHFLLDEKTEIDPVEMRTFQTTLEQLPHYPAWKDKIADHLKSSSIPRHQLVYFSGPADKNADKGTVIEIVESVLKGFAYIKMDGTLRRFSAGPCLLDSLNQIPYPKNTSHARCSVGEIKEEEFDDFSARPVGIPFSLDSFPERADNQLVVNRTNYKSHDDYHLFMDKANPHLEAFKELHAVIKKMPHAEVSPTYENPPKPWMSKYPSLLNMSRDREHTAYVIHSHLAPEACFWLAVIRVFVYYSRGLMLITNRNQTASQMLLGKAGKQLISYIEANSVRWKRDFGIGTDSLHNLPYLLAPKGGKTEKLPFEQDCIYKLLACQITKVGNAIDISDL